MYPPFSYPWFIRQFEQAKSDAGKFILSLDEVQFLQPPAPGKWCVAECYSHLINFGTLYYKHLKGELSPEVLTGELEKAFPPRFFIRPVIRYFEPPYNIKMKTFEEMKPGPVSGYSRVELLEEYLNLQDRFIALLKQFKSRGLDLQKSKMPHPIYTWFKLTLSESFALIEAHQRRHQWQAEQGLNVISQNVPGEDAESESENGHP